MMTPLPSLLLLSLLAGISVAQTCWKNLTCSNITEPAFPGKGEANIFAPSSRTMSPKSYFPITDLDDVRPWEHQASFPRNGSLWVFDFGQEVGGIVTIRYNVACQTGAQQDSCGNGAVGLAFTEAKNWIGEWSDSSNGAMVGPDGAIYSNFTQVGEMEYSMPEHKLRAGFRYMTLFLVSETASVDVSDIELDVEFMPTWSNLRAYQGYFDSDDSLLSRIWYGGAWALQGVSVPRTYGRWFPFVTTGWEENGTLSDYSPVLVDGAKRDREIWPGDMGISVPSLFVSLGDMEGTRNALLSMYQYQNPDGEFPQAGPPLLQQGSTDYHMFTMITTYNYALYTNDLAFLNSEWDGYKRAMDWVTGHQTYSSGLLNVTGLKGWGQLVTGYNGTMAQVLLVETLRTGATMAGWLGGSENLALATKWTAAAEALRNATITYCYDSDYGAFRSNATTSDTLYPQGANAMAVAYGLVDPNSEMAQSISARLTQNWTPIGANCPELPGEISPYISGFELQAHLIAGQAQRAVDLMRLSWGWQINNPNGTESTPIEGYLVNGSFAYRYNDGYQWMDGQPDPSYVSHCHGWSTGPNSALINFIVGLTVVSPAGADWRFAPQFADLKTAEGGFTTYLGKYSAVWSLESNKCNNHWSRWGGSGYSATLQTPSGTKGTIVLPVVQAGRMPSVTLNGKSAKLSWSRTGIEGVSDLVEISDVEGGDYDIEVCS